jgi:hypothetical protein
MKRPLFLLLAITVCLFLIPNRITAAGEDWKPIDPGQLALKSPTVEKEADAEALFWEVRIDDNPEGNLIFNHYIRIKVFTERGRESQSKIDILYGNLYGGNVKVKDIAARTIKADGSIVELKKDDVFDRTIVKVSGLKFKAKSFAMPAVEPGCIIEYRWREVRVNRDADNVRLQFQRDIPVQRVDYYIKPYAYENASFNSITLHGKSSSFVKDKGGFYRTTMTDMPAVYEESRMPPEDEVKTWMLVYYANASDKPDPVKYWSNLGKRFYEGTKSLIKPNDDVKQLAGSLTTDAKTDTEKLERLFEFCRTKIKNTSNDASGLTEDERKKLKDNKSPSDTLKRATGTSLDIDLLFASLTSASGFDARIVLAPDRGDMFFDKGIPNSYFLNPTSIAVNVGGTWKFFNPGYNYIPFGMLRWQEEGEQSLITDPKEPVWVNSPMSGPDKSVTKRRAQLKLSEDGTLEGDVTLEYTGHSAFDRKEDMDEESESQREENLKTELKGQMSGAEITNIKIENVIDHVKPLVISYHVNFPGYAQRTGKRLFLQPAFFQRGIGPLFASTGRKYPVYFHYAWTEDDVVEIEVPNGYLPDNADAPPPLVSKPVSEYKPTIAISTDNKLLVYKRSFYFGGGDMVLFPVATYTQLKTFFDIVHKEDNHSIAFKQGAASN